MTIEALYNIFRNHSVICTDTRKLTPDSLFFALKGAQYDGNLFAEEALKTCAYAIVDNPEVAKNERFIVVDNVLKTLQGLANFHRLTLKTTLIGITGSNGKTTTKELIAKVLESKYPTLKTEGNLNNHIGVPLTLLKLKKEHQFGIIEMGANHPGEIKELCAICEPNYGIITNVGKAHLEGFGSFEGVIKAKGELYDYLRENNGVVFIHSDNIYLEEMNPPKTVIYYGVGNFNHCQGTLINHDIFMAYSWIPASELSPVEIQNIKTDETYHIYSKLIGKYNFANALAATCIGNYFQIPASDIKKAIESYAPENHRSQVLDTKLNKLILDSYNANPSSMDAAITNFVESPFNNKSIILGDMMELGDAATREHGVILGMLQKLNLNQVYLVGDIFYSMRDFGHFSYFKTTSELKCYLTLNPLTNDIVLIKGSRAMGLEQLIEVL